MRIRKRFIVLFILLIVIAGAGLWVYRSLRTGSNGTIARWFSDPSSRAELATVMNRTACPGAPFILPSDGLIGLLWNDPAAPYSLLNTHSGLDIFGDGEPGEVPVYAAYEGYLSRLPDWVSSVIISHDDPLQPRRPIWTYYTHMASRDGRRSFVASSFPAGTAGVWVEQGTLLGYQGEYAGSTGAIGLHIHFSVVLSEANGAFLNETRITNTLDPSPYLGMLVNIGDNPARPIRCRET